MAERKSKSSILTLAGNGLLLLCAMVGLLRTFLSLYPDILARFTHIYVVSFIRFPGDPDTTAPVQLTVLAVVLALVALAVWSLPRFRLPVAAVLAVLLATAILHYRLYWIDGAQLVCSAIVDMFHQRVGWFGAMDYVSMLALVDQLQAVLLFLASALAALALLLGWCIVCARRWWLVLLLTLPPILPGLLADLYPDWPFFLMLAACWCTMLLTSLCKWAIPASRGKLTLIALPAVGVLLAVLISVLPQEGYTRPDWAFRAETSLTDFTNRYLPFLPDGEGAATTATAKPVFVGAMNSVDLSSAGPLNYSGRTVLQVSGDYSGHIYLRGASLVRYTGTSWEPLHDGTFTEFIETQREQWGDRWQEGSPLLYPALVNIDGERHSITVQNIGASFASVYLPYQMADQEFNQLEGVEDAFFASPTGLLRHTVSYLPGLLDLSTVTPNAGTDMLRTEKAYAAFVEEQYLHLQLSPALEGVLSSRLAKLPEYAAASIDNPNLSLTSRERLMKAQQVAALLDDLCQYDPDTPLTPDGTDFVGYFLAESHRGYCMHFASAAALMLRYLGVPARYVSGFVADVDEDRMVNVPDSAAHAWVEIYLPDYGWYPVEVTPGYSAGASPLPSDPLPTQSAAPTPEPTPTPSAPPSAAPSQTSGPTAAPTPSQAPAATTTPGLTQILKVVRRAAGWLIPAAGLAALLWLGQFLPKCLRKRRLSSLDTNRAALDGYRYLTQLERWGGRMDDGVLELAQKARFSQHTLTRQECQLVAARFQEERLRIAQTLSPVRKLLFRYFWGVPQ